MTGEVWHGVMGNYPIPDQFADVARLAQGSTFEPERIVMFYGWVRGCELREAARIARKAKRRTTPAHAPARATQSGSFLTPSGDSKASE